MIAGARQGTLSGLRRLVALSMARDLGVFIIPGPDVMRAHGLDIEAVGMQIVASPRHASVLLVVGNIPPALCEAAAVIYAQMMRPRVLFALGATELSPLPPADVVAGISQQELAEGVRQLRTALADGAFRADVSDFDAPMLQTRIEYTCSMHPEIIRDEPGSCPKCGMNLIPRETQAGATHDHAEHKMEGDDHAGMNHNMNHDEQPEYTCPMHPEVIQNEPGSCPKCGMDLEPRDVEKSTSHDHQHMAHEAAVEYTCPMHPEVVQSEPGSCPKCGMDLEQRDVEENASHDHHHMAHEAAVEYTCPMHPEVVQSEPGSCPKCGMDLEPRDVEENASHDYHQMSHEAAVEYTCPMHPEVVQSEPGSCPKCGMFLEPREQQNADHDHGDMDHSSMDHSNMDHGDMGFMSMIDVTKDLPRSGDGLPMDWIDVPFGPFFPGLPGGLLVTLTLDGDTVAGSSADTLVGKQSLLQGTMDASKFIQRLTSLDPLAPVSYQVLACQAIENAAVMETDTKTATARMVAVERERIVSHLGWLALFGRQTSFDWLLRRTTSLQRDFLNADIKQIAGLKVAVSGLGKRLRRTPILKSRTTGIGRLSADMDMTMLGPVARASGINNDVRCNSKIYNDIGFEVASGTGGDVRARLQLRLDEISHSLALIEKAGRLSGSLDVALDVSVAQNIEKVNGSGEAVIETPRGSAHLQLSMENGHVISAQLQTPSTSHLGLIEKLTEQQELGDALVAIGSLDLSPWEIRS